MGLISTRDNPSIPFEEPHISFHILQKIVTTLLSVTTIMLTVYNTKI